MKSQPMDGYCPAHRLTAAEHGNADIELNLAKKTENEDKKAETKAESRTRKNEQLENTREEKNKTKDN